MRALSFRLAVKRFGSLRLWHSFLLGALLLAAVPQAKASFIGYYSFTNFTLINLGGNLPNGTAASPDTQTVVLTGTNDGSSLPGSTELTIVSPASGLFRFSYVFNSADNPTFEYAGYILGGSLFQLADTDGQNGSVNVPVLSGSTIGFYVGSFDNTGGAGVLTVTNFSAPPPVGAPEPASWRLLLAGLFLAGLARWRRRIAPGIPRVLRSGLAVTALAAGLTAPLLAQQVFYSGTNVTGQLAAIATVNVSHAATPLSAPLSILGGLRPAAVPAETLKPPGPRLHPPFAFARMLSAAVAPVSLPSLSIVSPAGLQGFNALSHLDQRQANNGNQFSVEPPSQSIAVGNGYVLEGVNNAIQIYTTSGAPVLPLVLASNQLFGLPPEINFATGVNGVYPTDMRVFYDPGINRWMVLQRSQDNDVFGNELNSSHLYLAVSQTGDPTGNYTIYLMTTTNMGHPGCPCIADYPQIGADQYGFHIAWNEFNSASIQFVDAAILSLSKASLASGAAAPTAVQFLLPYTTGYEFAIQPATTPPGASNFLGNGGLEYFVSTFSSFAQSSQVALWAMTNTSSLATTPSLTLTRVTIPVLTYTFPDVATQLPGPTPYGTTFGAPLEVLDGGDPRVQSLSYAAGHLYIAFATGVNDQNGKWVVGSAYVVLTPTFRNGVLAAQVLNQGYLLLNNNHLLRPNLAVNAQGRGAIGVTLVGGDWDPSAAVIPFTTTGTPTTLQVAAPGALPEDGFSGYPPGGGGGIARWGDYNTAVVSSDGAIWMVVQYIANLPRTTAANWNTYVIRYQ